MVRVQTGARDVRPAHLIAIAVLAALAVDLSLHFRPSNYLGGSSDEQRYLEAALRWITDGPQAGTTHWSLRHPLILGVVASFKAFGISIATLQLPCRLAFDLLAGLTAAMLLRWSGWRAALAWTAIVVLVPDLHKYGTNCGPEMIELLFAVASLWSFWEARAGLRSAMALSGLMLGVAVMTRETSACLLAVYAAAFLRRAAPRRLAPWFVLGFAVPVAIDTGWLWWMTGHPLYRIVVDQQHTHIFSADLKGGIYAGRVLFNPDLASRWKATGPSDLWWPIDPLVDLFVAPQFGMVFLAWGVLALAPPTRARGGLRRLQPWLIGIVGAGYLWVVWALTLSPQPRYQLVSGYAATIAVALLLAQPAPGASRWVKRLACAFIAVGGGLAILLSPDRQRDARLILPWLAQHPGAVLHFDIEDGRRIAFPAILAGRFEQISEGSITPTGALHVRQIEKPHGPGAWQEVAVLRGPHLFPYINPPRTLIVERRVR